VAKHIGADTVIYQTLDDLKAACLELCDENGLVEPKEFEVGVFCGKYVTPVSEGYFDHLEKMRGEGRKMKLMESARKAVLTGVASRQDFQVAANGVAVDPNGKVVPATTPERSRQRPHNTNSHDSHDQPPMVKDRMDISLHNLGDYS
jgi:amidophosphoribosyltransferase